MRRYSGLIVIAVGTLALTSCGGSSGGNAAAAPSPAGTSPSIVGSAIVGQWTADTDCRGMQRALSAAGLGAAEAPILQDFFPDLTPRELAKKADICDGAPPPARHAHYFSASGLFGSLDQNDQQVDDGKYLATATDLYICDSTEASCSGSTANGHFHYEVARGQLTLRPLITPAQMKQALANPLEFERAGWMVAVAYPGHPWSRTECSRCA